MEVIYKKDPPSLDPFSEPNLLGATDKSIWQIDIWVSKTSIVIISEVWAMAGDIIELKGSDYESFLKENRVVLVDFWAPWCMPCVVQGNLLEGGMEGLPDGARVAKLNVDENPDIARKLGIMGIPQLFLFVDGNPVQGWTGVTPPDVLFSAMNDHLK